MCLEYRLGVLRQTRIGRHHPRKRVIQYPRAARFEPRSCGVLDTPLSRGMTAVNERSVPRGQDKGRTELFDNLSEKLGGILDRLTRRGSLTEADVDAAMREVRRALLEADVSLDVVRSFTEQGPRAGGRRHRGQVGHPRPDGGQDRPRRVDRHARLRRPDHRPQCACRRSRS